MDLPTHLAIRNLLTGKKRLTTLEAYLPDCFAEARLRVRSLLRGESTVVGNDDVENVTCPCVDRTGTDHGCSDCEGDCHSLSCDGCGAHRDGFGLCEECRDNERAAEEHERAHRASGWS